MGPSPHRATPGSLAPTAAYRVATISALRHRHDFDPEVWCRVVLATDTAGFIALIEASSDWAPWRPMLELVEALRRNDPQDTLLLDTAAHLRRIARELLDAQGFGAVDVAHTLGGTPRLRRAIDAVLFPVKPR